jgi:fructosamine-3-kinase
MVPWREIERAIGEATGASFAIESRARVAGGCINECHVVRGGGRAYFVKVNAAQRAQMFAAEAEGLEEIARTGTVRVPAPLCHGVCSRFSWLVLEHLELQPATDRSMRELGRRLARMHRVTAARFGWRRDNAIGSTPQPNAQGEDWIAFWRSHRLGFQLELAAAKGYGGRLIALGERLLEKLPAFFAGYRPQPSLLHGDLWAGNVAATAAGEPVLFDPAVYYGDREADIAMTELFGGFAPAFYEAYRAEYPLEPGYEVRRQLYNLYHVLNHLNLFGGAYRARAERTMGELIALA